jgi:hypothetical protein
VPEDSAHDQRIKSGRKAQIGCMRMHGPLEDILIMIEEGDQGKPLQARVQAIREDTIRMQTLTELWEGEDWHRLMEIYPMSLAYEDGH